MALGSTRSLICPTQRSKAVRETQKLLARHPELRLVDRPFRTIKIHCEAPSTIRQRSLSWAMTMTTA